MVGIDEAAAAFTAEINKSEAPISRGGRRAAPPANEGPTERVFGNVGDLEVDDDSPPKGGGDDMEDPPIRGKESLGNEDDDAEEDLGDESKEDEDESKEDEEEDEGEEGLDEEALGQKFTVLVDGEEQEVTLKEALEGYTRTKTFHQRMNDVEEAKKIISRTAADAVQNYEHAAALVAEIQGHLDQMVPEEPNWDEEFRKDPIKAREKQKYYEGVKQFRTELQKKVDTAREEARKSHLVQTKAFAEEEGRKFVQMNAKQWSVDPKRKQRDLQAMRRTALAQGFSEEEVNTVYDSRMLQILLKASRYDRMMASKPKPAGKPNGKQPVSQGSSARTRKGNKNLSNSMKRLNKSGSIEDASAVFSDLIARER